MLPGDAVDSRTRQNVVSPSRASPGLVDRPGDEFTIDSEMSGSRATWRTLSACCAGILAGIPPVCRRAGAPTRPVATNGDTARKNACATSPPIGRRALTVSMPRGLCASQRRGAFWRWFLVLVQAPLLRKVVRSGSGDQESNADGKKDDGGKDEVWLLPYQCQKA